MLIPNWNRINYLHLRCIMTSKGCKIKENINNKKS